jgi:hypothetical protein
MLELYRGAAMDQQFAAAIGLAAAVGIVVLRIAFDYYG